MANTAKTWYLLNPEGEEIEVTNLSQFCKDQGLSYSRVWNMLNGESVYGSVTCKGFKKSRKSPTQHIAQDEICLAHDDGRITRRSRYRKHVARDAGISTSSLHRLLTGAANVVAGWRLTTQEPNTDTTQEPNTVDLQGEEEL